MKKLLALASFCAVIFSTSFAQEHKKPLSPPAKVENKLVVINYSQPSVRSRKIFGEGSSFLQPYGQIWRVGANAATTIEAKEDIKFGGKLLKKGTYALYSIPNKNEWTFIINGNPKQWGTEYEKNKDKDLFQITEKPETLSPLQETFTMTFEGKFLVLKWENTEVKIPITKA
ncbi:hypothetical protein A9P82_03135 [Arachidicoccus ginsenosidimutans]|uniref:DUF2911 domain-containing protein n=1 Tax=Arachidicoccus sp. BS20 TaxID=1850526 RepID=UPI0007F16848|nr:DUF2911 domain-containing protein [Arachidicoccus sp. BS20]ANI90584.1 hypothetical protein A9P82_03135 [Arachidicoccus sp. BS20]